MEITPEIIATEIFGWHKETRKIASGEIIEIWIGPTPKEAGLQLSSTGSISGLPTFQESEWTGPLLEKAASISEAYMLRYREDRKEYSLGIWRRGFLDVMPKEGINIVLNYAIAEAILDAEGK